MIFPLHNIIFNQSDSGLYWSSRPALIRGISSDSSDNEDDENEPTFSGVPHYIKATPSGWDIYPTIGGSGLSGTYTLELLNGTATFTNGVLTAFTNHTNNLTLSLS